MVIKREKKRKCFDGYRKDYIKKEKQRVTIIKKRRMGKSGAIAVISKVKDNKQRNEKKNSINKEGGKIKVSVRYVQ